MTGVELVAAAGATCGEGPHWIAERGELLWVDIPQGRVHLLEPRSGASRTLQLDEPVGVAVPRERGGLVVAVPRGFAALDLETGTLELLAEVEIDRPDTRMNDGKCDAAGRLWAGTMARDDRAAQGSLYRLDVDGRVTRMVGDVSISNGIGWSL